MSEDKEYRKMCCLNGIESMCDELDFLVDPAVEEKMFCDFGCCIGNSIEKRNF